MTLRQGLCVLGLILLTGTTGSAQTVWHTELHAARSEAERLNRPILCHFGAKWCAPCQKMERTVLNQSHVTQVMRGRVVGLKVDVDANPDLAHRFGVTQFPTDVFIEPTGQRLMISTGYQSPEEYIGLLERAGRRYDTLLASREQKTTPPVQSAPSDGKNSSKLTGTSDPRLMLEGYCPVTLKNDRTWKKGDPELSTQYKQQIYHFASREAREEFFRHPDTYVPQFLGCDPVVVWTTDRAIPGSIEWGAFYDNQLYLFSSNENRRKFKESPDKYLTTKIVLHVDQIEWVLR